MATSVPKNVPRNVPKNRLQEIFELIRENSEITSSQTAEILGVSDKTVKRDISKLKADKRIERVGSLKTGHWIVGFLSGLMQMTTGGSAGLQGGTVSVDRSTGEVTMKFKLPGF